MRPLLLLAAMAALAGAQSVTISAPVFSGSGLNDATSCGRWTALPEYAIFVATISTTGTPDHFTWTQNGGTSSSAIAITSGCQLMANGVGIQFGATTGHTLADPWTINANASGSLAAANTIQAGVGTTTRTAEAKVRERVSFGDFGIVPDDLGTDYTPQIQTAVANCRERTGLLYATAGAYKISTPLELLNNQPSGGCTIAGDSNTGTVFVSAINPATPITAASNANPAVLTVPGHGLLTGGAIIISGFTGAWVALNGEQTITRTGPNSFSVPKDSTSFGALAGTPTYDASLISIVGASGQQTHAGLRDITLTTNPSGAALPATSAGNTLTGTGIFVDGADETHFERVHVQGFNRCQWLFNDLAGATPSFSEEHMMRDSWLEDCNTLLRIEQGNGALSFNGDSWDNVYFNATRGGQVVFDFYSGFLYNAWFNAHVWNAGANSIIARIGQGCVANCTGSGYSLNGPFNAPNVGGSLVYELFDPGTGNINGIITSTAAATPAHGETNDIGQFRLSGSFSGSPAPPSAGGEGVLNDSCQYNIEGQPSFTATDYHCTDVFTDKSLSLSGTTSLFFNLFGQRYPFGNIAAPAIFGTNTPNGPGIGLNRYSGVPTVFTHTAFNGSLTTAVLDMQIPSSPQTYPTTTITSGSFALGARTVTPASMIGIGDGDSITVQNPASPFASEIVTVSAVTATTFTATFANAHTAAAVVYPQQRALAFLDATALLQRSVTSKDFTGALGSLSGGIGTYISGTPGSAGSSRFGLGNNLRWQSSLNCWLLPSDGANNGGAGIFTDNANGYLDGFSLISSFVATPQCISNAGLAAYQVFRFSSGGLNLPSASETFSIAGTAYISSGGVDATKLTGLVPTASLPTGFSGTKTRTVCTTISGGVPTGCSNVTETYIAGVLQ